jgi:hypothetical protein
LFCTLIYILCLKIITNYYKVINYYKYFKPSELLNESNPEQLIEDYVSQINQKLKSYGGIIRNKKDNIDEYKLLRRKIDGLRAYEERIKQPISGP